MPVTADIFRVSPTLTPTLSVGFNEAIDFCIWVLEYDRLRVPPFTHHVQGVGLLQQQGLTAEIWQAWFERVVRSQHPMLGWSGLYQSRSEWIEREVASHQGMAERLQKFPEWDDSEIDWQANRVALGQHYDLYQVEAQAAAQEAGLSSPIADVPPSNLFAGSLELRHTLETLWHRYDDFEAVQRLRQQGYPARWEKAQPQVSFSDQLKLPHLNLYQIAYAAPVTVSVPSCSIVTSEAIEDFGNEAFKTFALNAIDALS